MKKIFFMLLRGLLMSLLITQIGHTLIALQCRGIESILERCLYATRAMSTTRIIAFCVACVYMALTFIGFRIRAGREELPTDAAEEFSEELPEGFRDEAGKEMDDGSKA